MIPLENYIDHTLLKPTATASEIRKLCREAKTYEFYAVCVNSTYISLVSKELHGSNIKIAAVVGFPLGATATELKIGEARYCIEHGADEIDMVMNLGWLRAAEYELVLDEIRQMKKTIGDGVLKVIIETALLSDEEKVKACQLVVEAGADFVKTSTGFGPGGATFNDVALILKTVENKARVKASGGIRDRETALHYIDMGVHRLGTSSGVKII